MRTRSHESVGRRQAASKRSRMRLVAGPEAFKAGGSLTSVRGDQPFIWSVCAESKHHRVRRGAVNIART